MPIHSRYQYPEKRKHHNFPLKYPATKTAGSAAAMSTRGSSCRGANNSVQAGLDVGERLDVGDVGERLGVGDVGEKLSSVAFDCQITGHVKY